MLINLLNAITYWFNQDEPISWLKEEWTQYLWYAVLALGVLFLLMIFVLFIKAIKRSRERAVERRIAREVAEATKEQRKAEKEEQKRQKKEKKQKRVEETATQEQTSTQQPPIVVVAGAEQKQEPVERVLTGITLDVGVVERDFHVGDEFSCDGLLVNANFNVAPLQETFANFTVVDASLFDKAVSGSLSGLYVCRPDLSKAGKLPVRVCFNKQVAMYTISVTEKPVEEPKKEEQPQPAAAVAVAPEQPKAPERVLNGITLDVGVVQRDFHVGDVFNCDGLLVNAAFSAAPLQETLANYTVVDASTFDQAVNGSLSGLYVCRPDLSRSGKLAVRVCYNKLVALYTIAVTEKPVEQPVQPVQQQPVQQAYVAPVQQQPTQPVGPREMISLTVNTDYVRRDFFAGDSLTYEGLIVNAHYNREPFKEQVYNYTVIAPDMSKPGNPTVVVMFQDRATSYTVTVRPNPYAQQQQQHFDPYAQQPVQQQPVQQPVVQKERVLTRVSVNSDFVKKDYVVGDTFSREGLMVTAHYNVEPLQEQVTNFTVIPPDMRREGMATVMVAYQDRMVSYQINVRPAPVVAKPEPVVAPVVEQPKAIRELQSVTLDTGVVQREFEVGEEFNCDGLLVNGNYSLAPMLETYADYNVVDAVSFDQVMHADVTGVYVCEPDMRTAGKKVVRVCLHKHIALYTISVRSAEKKTDVEPQQQPQLEPQQPQVIVVEQPAPVKSEPDRAMLYITLATDNVQKEFVLGDNLNTEGLVVYAHFSREPYMEQVTSYSVTAPDMSHLGRYTVGVHYQDKTVGYQISVVEAPVVEEKKPEPQPVVVEVQPQVVAQQPSQIVVEEESYEGRLRYDRSFNARVIQSDDKTKAWYTDVKNELLSYKKVHGRISWKRETFKCGKSVVAKLAYRGNTLVLMLPVNAADYADTKYALEDISDTPSNVDTPAMMRLKSDKRVKQALELIEEVMDQLGIDKDKKYVPEDFYVPYEGVFELIKKGLIKREIKTAADEAVFTGGQSEEGEDDAYELTEVAPGVFISPKK